MPSSDHPRVLLFIDWFTPGYKAGGPTRSMVNLIRRLKTEIDFYVVTRNTDYLEKTPYPGITPDIWLEQNGYHIMYLSGPSIRSIRSALHRFMEQAGTNPILLYLNGIWSFYFSILPLLCIRIKQFQKIIIAPRGMLSSQTWVSSGNKKKLFLRLARLTEIYKRAIFHATNEQEKEDIRKNIGNNVPVVVLPNLPAAVSSIPQEKTKTPGEARFISIARIAPEKNTRFMLEVLRQGITGKLSLDLYGPVYNEAYWEECKKIIAALPPDIKVTYHGPLAPENLPAATASCHFLFMPSLGENYGHSIVECLQQGLPVLISDKTPWRKLEEKNIGWDLPLDQPQAFRNIINRCLAMENEEYSLMQKKCLDYMLEILNDKDLIKKYGELLSTNG